MGAGADALVQPATMERCGDRPRIGSPAAQPPGQAVEETPEATTPGEPAATSSYVLRPMTASDVPQIVAIERRVFGADAWPARAFQEEQCNRVAYYFVLTPAPDKRPGVIAGYVGLWALSDSVQIVTIAVRPESQRGGLGELLVQRAFALAEEVGAEEVTLECRESNEPARRLYGKYGFEEVGRRRRYYQDNGEDALIMTAPALSAAARRRRDQLRSQHRARFGIVLRDETDEVEERRRAP